MLAKALARSLDCSFSRLQFTPDLLPVRRHGRQRLQPARERVRVPAGPGLREPPARRRDQPRLAEDAGRAARVHAGAPGHDRRRHVPARPRRSWSWRRRTRSSTRARTRCPRRSSTASRCGSRIGYPPLGRARRRCSTSRRATRRSTRSSRSRPRPERHCDVIERARARLRRGEPRTGTSSRCCGRRGATAASTSARARARGSRCCASRRRGRSADGRDYVVPDDVKAVAGAGARTPADPRPQKARARRHSAAAARPRRTSNGPRSA